MSYPLETQEQTYWCWAAVAASVRAHFDRPTALTQCQVATRTLDRFEGSGHDCCNDPSPCNMPYFLDRALTTLGHLNAVYPDPLSWNDVQFFLNRNRPVCAFLESASSGHYVVITDCLRTTSGVEYLFIHDPGDNTLGAVQVRYESFLWNYRESGYQWIGVFLVRP